MKRRPRQAGPRAPSAPPLEAVHRMSTASKVRSVVGLTPYRGGAAAAKSPAARCGQPTRSSVALIVATMAEPTMSSIRPKPTTGKSS